MSADIIQQITATIQFEPHADKEGGCPILVPVVTIASLIARGFKSYTFTIDLTGPESRRGKEWLTVSEAARLHESDVDGMSFARARARIRRACDSGEIISSADQSARRIDPDSLAAWRLRAREKDLDGCDL